MGRLTAGDAGRAKAVAVNVQKSHSSHHLLVLLPLPPARRRTTQDFRQDYTNSQCIHTNSWIDIIVCKILSLNTSPHEIDVFNERKIPNVYIINNISKWHFTIRRISLIPTEWNYLLHNKLKFIVLRWLHYIQYMNTISVDQPQSGPRKNEEYFQSRISLEPRW